jgi:hypothetical protein
MLSGPSPWSIRSLRIIHLLAVCASDDPLWLLGRYW